MQCMVERRRGGETGVKAVQYLCGDAVWAARDAGLWDEQLAYAAVTAVLKGGTISIATSAQQDATGQQRIRLEDCTDASVFLIEYSDGFRAATLMLDGYLNAFAFAGRRCESGEIDGKHNSWHEY